MREDAETLVNGVCGSDRGFVGRSTLDRKEKGKGIPVFAGKQD
jgi:hypothetical protein